ncbi:hypothetical protein [Geodermatophilus sp. SYSU D00815]
MTEFRTPLQELRRAGHSPGAVRAPDLLRTWAAAERLRALELREDARRRRGPARPPADAAPDWSRVWPLRHFLAERTAEIARAAQEGRASDRFADTGAALANCDAVQRLLDTWEVLAGWAEDPDAEPADAYRIAADGLHRAMWRLALHFADHPGFDPAWRPGSAYR